MNTISNSVANNVSKVSVLYSITDVTETRCLDFFSRDNKTYGFEEYRREIEDAKGWYSIGGYKNLIFKNPKTAMSFANERVIWFKEVCIKHNL